MRVAAHLPPTSGGPSHQACSRPQVRISGPAPGIPVGRAAEVWYASASVWDARKMSEGKQVKICADEEAIMSTSRASGEIHAPRTRVCIASRPP